MSSEYNDRSKQENIPENLLSAEEQKPVNHAEPEEAVMDNHALVQEVKPVNPIMKENVPYFTGLALIYSLCFAVAFYRNFMGITYPLITAVTLAVCILFLRKNQIPWQKSNWWYVGGSILLGVSTVFTANEFVIFFNTVGILLLITVFMILFGVNFNMYFLLLIKEVKSVWKNEEVRAYFIIIAGAIAAITINTYSVYESIGKAFRYSAFQVASIITTTGFGTADFNMWPEFSKAILMTLMVIGACAGSTGGGMKVSRFLILLKSIKKEVKQLLHPKAVSVTRINEKKVGADTLRGVYIYFFAYILILVVSVLIVSLNNFDFSTTFSSVLTTLNNVGPGISLVGPTENFAKFSGLSKLVFCFDMLAGRLEIFPILMVMSPSLWRRRF